MVDEWTNGDFSVDPCISIHMTHDQVNTAFDLLNAGVSIRFVIHFRPEESITVN